MRVCIAPDRGVAYKGDHLAGGREYDVDDVFGAILCSEGRATKVEPTPADVVETREPVATHRDPAVRRRGTRG